MLHIVTYKYLGHCSKLIPTMENECIHSGRVWGLYRNMVWRGCSEATHFNFFFMITGHRQFPLAKQHAGCPRCWLSIASAGALLNLQPQGRCQWSSVDSAWISFCSEGVDKNLRLLYGEKFDFCSALVTITGYGEFSV